jgi:nucleoside-diphosphate-sugar epimerase
MGSSEAVTMTELADILLKISGKELEKVYQPAEPTGCWKRSCDNTRIKKLVNWEPDTPLLEGLTRTFIWVKNNI